MTSSMLDWINNAHADFVLAAYATAFVALWGMMIASLCEYKRRAKEWKFLSERRAESPDRGGA